MRQSVMERNCLGFIPAIKCYMVLSLSSTIYYGTVCGFVQSIEKFLPGIKPMTSCFELLPSTSTPLRHVHINLHLSFWSPPPYTQAASAVPPVLPRFPQYIAGVSEHSIMLNQNSLCFDTEKWFLCNNTILFV